MKPYKILIIPGGGQLADNLRTMYKQEPDKFGKEAEYHWKAIGCMDKNAVTIYEIFKNGLHNKNDIDSLYLISDINEYINAQDGIFIFQPLNDLKIRDPKELVHTWEVTSDSIAIFFAYILKIKTALLLKDEDFFIYQMQKFARIDSRYLEKIMSESGYLQKIETHLGKGTSFPVDPFIPRLVRKLDTNVILLNGNNMEKIERFLKYYPVMEEFDYIEYGTLIVP